MSHVVLSLAIDISCKIIAVKFFFNYSNLRDLSFQNKFVKTLMIENHFDNLYGRLCTHLEKDNTVPPTTQKTPNTLPSHSLISAKFKSRLPTNDLN